MVIEIDIGGNENSQIGILMSISLLSNDFASASESFLAHLKFPWHTF
jgi:hypothetical protein